MVNKSYDNVTCVMIGLEPFTKKLFPKYNVSNKK